MGLRIFADNSRNVAWGGGGVEEGRMNNEGLGIRRGPTANGRKWTRMADWREVAFTCGVRFEAWLLAGLGIVAGRKAPLARRTPQPCGISVSDMNMCAESPESRNLEDGGDQ